MRRTTSERPGYQCRATTTGEELRQFRSDRHLSSLALAESWGVSGTAIRQWETGVRPIPCWVDRAIAEMRRAEVPV